MENDHPDGVCRESNNPVIRTFVSFDIEHDRELYEQLLAESRTSSSGFMVSGGSEPDDSMEVCSAGTRDRIREAEQVIVICGEHTESSMSVSAELRFAQQQETPYFLLWGRREIMCTKPVGAEPADGIYSWTRQFLREQLMLSTTRTGPGSAARIQRESHPER